MAEKQLAYRTDGKDEIFAEDDPLAELARIVGFEPRSSAPPTPANQRHEPAFDLEDELLREFERYDVPRASSVDEISIVPEDETIYGEAAYSQPGNENIPPAEPHHHVEPEFAELSPETDGPYFEPEVLVETHEDAYPGEQVEEAPAAQAALEPAADTYSAISEPAEPEPAVEPVARDLADELELSIGNAPVARPVTRTPQWAAASIRLPLANFNAPRKQEPPVEPIAPAEEVRVAIPAEPQPEPQAEIAAALDIHESAMDHDFGQASALGFPSEQDRHEGPVPEQSVANPSPVVEAPIFDLVAAAEHGDVQADAALTEPAYEVLSATGADDFDDLLADVSRYPVPSRGESAPREEPQFSAVSAQPAAQSAAIVPEPPSVDEVQAAATSDDPFADFDFDFEGIEMELAELDFSEQKNAPSQSIIADSQARVVAAEPAPQRSLATPLATPRVVQAVRPELAARPASAPILTLPPSAAPAPLPVAALPVFDSEQPLPFDPTEITDTEDRLETFDGTSVPSLPHVEKEEPVVVPHEYDFDIDAELANLFSQPAKEAAPQALKAAPAAAPRAADAAMTNPTGRSGEELDEFEKALEEDFRRSFTEPQEQPADNVARMTLESSSATTDRRRARSMRGFAVAAAAVLVLGAGAYGVRGFLFHGSSLGLSSGDPRVITADKEPVKVAPENPGGKVVPNQDKAVYDRVAGDATQPPKQKQLVSSNEQPVDVVQKTLIPEAMSPDDNDGGVADTNGPVTATPVGETQDPRLLPGQGNSTDNAAAAGDQENAPSVSPRKVRTMIVKPDGTLVARDEPAPAADNSAKTPAPTAAKQQDSVAPARPVTPTANAAPAASQVASTSLRATESGNATSSTHADAPESDAASAESTPIRVVKTTKIGDAAPATAQASDTAPVPSARPAQPAAAAKAAVPPKQTEVATAAPAPKQAPVAAPVQKQVASATPATATASTAAASAGGYVMQIASLPSEDEAKRSQANLMAKFASIIGGHAIEVRKAEIAGKGTYYRVRVAAGSKDDAAALCVRFRAAGGTCLISK